MADFRGLRIHKFGFSMNVSELLAERILGIVPVPPYLNVTVAINVDGTGKTVFAD